MPVWVLVGLLVIAFALSVIASVIVGWIVDEERGEQ